MGDDLPQMLLKEEQMRILTHGYVHGHVHQHDDHMHIHGHFHNHDHVNQLELDAFSNDTVANTIDPSQANATICKELDTYDICSDILCDDLDDCYFYDCDKLAETTEDACCEPKCNLPCEGANEQECCHDPTCLESDEKVCMDPECLRNDHHDNSLCALQKSKMSIFEKLIQNVQKNIEELYSDLEQEDATPKRRKINNGSQLQIHFPHHCHPHKEETDLVVRDSVEPNSSKELGHNLHQSCFHAKVPHATVKSEDQLPPSHQSDYDFFIQFNNFKKFLDESTNKLPEATDHQLLGPVYNCKWEHCSQKVDDSNLVSHVVDAHLKNEYRMGDNHAIQALFQSQPAFECEWENCNYVDPDIDIFLSHVSTHRTRSSSNNALSINNSINNITNTTSISNITNTSNISSITNYPQNESLPGMAAALLTPTSIHPPDSPQNGLNITAMKIIPKAAAEKTPLDPLFTCQWQVGTDVLGQPIICNKTHENEGDLQHHLQEDHIGLGKPVYFCCWVGCERNGGKPFVQRQKLFRHIHIHTHYKPCECKECGSKFATPAMLRQHMRTHSGEKPFKCKICGKNFTTSSSLSIHNRVHSGERPLECKWPGCGKRFSESSNLAKHMRVHAKTYSCEVCGEIFEKKTSYTKHKKTHLGKNGPDQALSSGISYLDYIQT